MPIRNDQTAWSPAEVARLRVLSSEGTSAATTAHALNAEFHDGERVRSVRSVGMKRTHAGIMVAAARREPDRPAAPPEGTEQEVKRTLHADGSLEILAVGRRIKTVEDAIAHVEADMTRFEIAKVEATAWDTTLVDPVTKKARTIQNHRVYVQLKPKAGPNVREAVEAVLAGAFAPRRPVVGSKPKGGDPDILQGVVIADPHIGKLSWGEGTGGPNYDTAIAVDTLRRGVADVMAQGDERRVGVRHFWLLGDYFHHDGKGMTTKGTPLDYDTRVQKMLTAGSEVLFDLIASSAETVPTRVVLVPGNHDTVLTWALQRILVSEFRRHKGVTIDDSSTTTKYLTHGRCLIALDHGDKGKKRLPEVMAAQCAVEWGQTTCRHAHTGHLHGKAKVVTEGGVVVWTHDSLGPSDQWHVDEKYGSSPRTLEAFRYHRGGMFAGSDAWSPDLHAAPRRGTV